MKKIIIKLSNGFTLIELLVTIGIIVLLIAVSIPSFNRYGKYNEMYQTAQNIRSDIYQVRNYALSPRSSKLANIDFYRISFDTSAETYSLLEGPTLIKTEDLSTLGYDLICDRNDNISDCPSIVNIDFTISKQGQISMPLGQNNLTLKLANNKLSAPSNNVKIKINAQTGEVTLIQP